MKAQAKSVAIHILAGLSFFIAAGSIASGLETDKRHPVVIVKTSY